MVLLITTDGVPMSACWNEDGLHIIGRDYTADDHSVFKEINIDGARAVSFNSVDLKYDGGSAIITDQSENNAYVFGRNNNGELSLGDDAGSDVQIATRVLGFDGETIKDVSIVSSTGSSLWLTNSGKVFTCGKGDNYASGRTENQNVTIAEEIEYTDGDIADIYCASFGGWAVRNDRTMMAWGTNYDYFLGIGDYDYAETPQDLTIDLNGKTYKFFYSAIGTEDGNLQSFIAVENGGVIDFPSPVSLGMRVFDRYENNTKDYVIYEFT